ncbi:ANTAR domain-containing protein [Octadecabacter sp.]|nr:ANTAR domain-containing protein [Octadecabacter sp.]
MDKNLSIVVVEPDQDRAREIAEGLTVIGYRDILVIGDTAKLSSRVVAAQADVVLIDVANPSRDILEELAVVSDPLNRPVALFVDEDKEGLAKAAIESGISAYVVNGLSADRLRPVLDTAIARFNMVGRMRTELTQAKRALEERKVIDRAKGLLMKARGIDEEAAYALLRRTAMDQGRKVVDVAQALVTAADLLS